MALFEKKDPRQQFVAAVEKALRRLGVADPIEYDEDLFAFRVSGDRAISGRPIGHWHTERSRRSSNRFWVMRSSWRTRSWPSPTG
jgi:hypothetical protein